MRDEEAPAAAVALVRRLDSDLREHAPPTTDDYSRSSSDVGARSVPTVLRQLAQRRDGVWRRKR